MITLSKARVTFVECLLTLMLVIIYVLQTTEKWTDVLAALLSSITVIVCSNGIAEKIASIPATTYVKTQLVKNGLLIAMFVAIELFSILSRQFGNQIVCAVSMISISASGVKEIIKAMNKLKLLVQPFLPHCLNKRLKWKYTNRQKRRRLPNELIYELLQFMQIEICWKISKKCKNNNNGILCHFFKLRREILRRKLLENNILPELQLWDFKRRWTKMTEDDLRQRIKHWATQRRLVQAELPEVQAELQRLWEMRDSMLQMRDSMLHIDHNVLVHQLQQDSSNSTVATDFNSMLICNDRIVLMHYSNQADAYTAQTTISIKDQTLRVTRGSTLDELSGGKLRISNGVSIVYLVEVLNLSQILEALVKCHTLLQLGEYPIDAAEKIDADGELPIDADEEINADGEHPIDADEEEDPFYDALDNAEET